MSGLTFVCSVRSELCHAYLAEPPVGEKVWLAIPTLVNK